MTPEPIIETPAPDLGRREAWLASLPVGVALTEFQREQFDALRLLYPERAAPQEDPS